FFFFFFQAEDGIRDGHVTGVQTCALPIFRATREIHMRVLYLITRADLGGAQIHLLDLLKGLRGKVDATVAAGETGFFMDAVNERSEERRVGKECRCRGGWNG